MIPPPAGLRHVEYLGIPTAKRSLQRQLPYWSSDWPPANPEVVG